MVAGELADRCPLDWQAGAPTLICSHVSTIPIYSNTSSIFSNIFYCYLIQCATDVSKWGSSSRLIYAIIPNADRAQSATPSPSEAEFSYKVLALIMRWIRRGGLNYFQQSSTLPCLACNCALGCVSLGGCSPPQIWSSGPRAKWLLDKTSGQGGQRAAWTRRGREWGTKRQRRLLSDCGIGACHLLLSCLLPMWVFRLATTSTNISHWSQDPILLYITMFKMISKLGKMEKEQGER